MGAVFLSRWAARAAGLREVYDRGLQPLGHGTRLKPSNDLLEHFQWPLGLAIGLLLSECILNERRK